MSEDETQRCVPLDWFGVELLLWTIDGGQDSADKIRIVAAGYNWIEAEDLTIGGSVLLIPWSSVLFLRRITDQPSSSE